MRWRMRSTEYQKSTKRDPIGETQENGERRLTGKAGFQDVTPKGQRRKIVRCIFQ